MSPKTAGAANTNAFRPLFWAVCGQACMSKQHVYLLYMGGLRSWGVVWDFCTAEFEASPEGARGVVLVHFCSAKGGRALGSIGPLRIAGEPQEIAWVRIT